MRGNARTSRYVFLIMATVGAVAVGGVAYATHVPEVDPLTVPPGFLTAHNRVVELQTVARV